MQKKILAHTILLLCVLLCACHETDPAETIVAAVTTTAPAETTTAPIETTAATAVPVENTTAVTESISGIAFSTNEATILYQRLHALSAGESTEVAKKISLGKNVVRVSKPKEIGLKYTANGFLDPKQETQSEVLDLHICGYNLKISHSYITVDTYMDSYGASAVSSDGKLHAAISGMDAQYVFLSLMLQPEGKETVLHDTVIYDRKSGQTAFLNGEQDEALRYKNVSPNLSECDIADIVTWSPNGKKFIYRCDHTDPALGGSYYVYDTERQTSELLFDRSYSGVVYSYDYEEVYWIDDDVAYIFPVCRTYGERHIENYFISCRWDGQKWEITEHSHDRYLDERELTWPLYIGRYTVFAQNNTVVFEDLFTGENFVFTDAAILNWLNTSAEEYACTWNMEHGDDYPKFFNCKYTLGIFEYADKVYLLDMQNETVMPLELPDGVSTRTAYCTGWLGENILVFTYKETDASVFIRVR